MINDNTKNQNIQEMIMNAWCAKHQSSGKYTGPDRRKPDENFSRKLGKRTALLNNWVEANLNKRSTVQ